MDKFNLTKKEQEIFKKLNTPAKIQDFISSLSANFEEQGDTCMSPRFVLKTKKCHCVEGALLAASILKYHNFKPFVVDMRAVASDFDHVIAVFKIENKWGAISKSNHSVLRYREPVYKDIRELVMSYFHEYSDDKTGKKTLRSFSIPFNLDYFDHLDWITTEHNLFEIPEHLDKIKHFNILTKKQIKNLRKLEKIELEAGNIRQFKKK